MSNSWWVVAINVVMLIADMSIAMRYSRILRTRRVKKPYRPRVVEGWSDVDNRYPYVAIIESKVIMFNRTFLVQTCSGSLISNEWVLTAAHCLQPELTRIRCGDLSIPDTETKCIANILRQFPNTAYLIGIKTNNDIGLLSVENVEMERYGKIHGADYNTFAGRAVRYAGHGFTKRYWHELSKEELVGVKKKPLQIGAGVIIDDDDKVFQFYPRIVIAPKCDKKGQFPHSGDSGGPLFIDNRIVGVCSGGDDPLSYDEGQPLYAAYTPVSPYLDWIKVTMNTNQNRYSLTQIRKVKSGWVVSINVVMLIADMSIAMKYSEILRTRRVKKPYRRVVEGWSDIDNRYPYVVIIQSQVTMFNHTFTLQTCSGSLISNEWVLTAAHCLKSELTRIRCGDLSIPDTETKCIANILGKFANPAHLSGKRIISDIGLLYVENVEMEQYGKLHGADYNTFAGRAVRYAGYGLTKRYPHENSKEPPVGVKKKMLQIGAGMIVVDDDKLFEYYPRIVIAPKCDKKGQYPYSGDSGGPLLIGDRIAGVFSGLDDSLSYVVGQPIHAAYTPVSPYLDWIKVTMNTYQNRYSLAQIRKVKSG